MNSGKRGVSPSMYFLSGAPRVSTSEDGQTPGPRSHIEGITGAAVSRGISVRRSIAGDSRVAKRYFQGAGTDSLGTGVKGFLRDAVRIVWRYAFAAVCYRRRPETPFFVYERFGAMQDASLFLRRSAAAVVTESNGVFFEEAASDRGNLSMTGLARRWEIRKYRSSDLVVSVSDALTERLIQIEPRLVGKVVTIPNGVDERFLEAERIQRDQNRDLSDARVVVGWVGTMLPWQGLPELLLAVQKVRALSGLDMTVELVGDGPDRARCETIVEENGMHFVTFLGRVKPSAVPLFLTSLDLAYCGHLPLADAPMYHSPLKLYEYLAVGVPTVATRSNDVAQLYANNDCMPLVFDASLDGDLERALSAGVKRSINQELRDGLRQSIASDHSWTSRFRTIQDRVDVIANEGRGA